MMAGMMAGLKAGDDDLTDQPVPPRVAGEQQYFPMTQRRMDG